VGHYTCLAYSFQKFWGKILMGTGLKHWFSASEQTSDGDLTITYYDVVTLRPLGEFDSGTEFDEAVLDLSAMVLVFIAYKENIPKLYREFTKHVVVEISIVQDDTSIY
jgi:hypothetical protein